MSTSISKFSLRLIFEVEIDIEVNVILEMPTNFTKSTQLIHYRILKLNLRLKLRLFKGQSRFMLTDQYNSYTKTRLIGLH